jgi:Holliday junction resolvase RusA-like endonuclease
VGKPIIITLPVPSKRLHPNDRSVWQARLRPKRLARTLASLVAGQQRPKEPLDAPACRIIWKVNTKRRRDTDNLVAWCKAYTDGLTDAGIWADDSRVTWVPPAIEYEKGCEARIVYVVARSVEDLENL